ncbi:MAG: ferric reductase-like transmembrane domain-containing protein [Thermoflexaceae bacterium]|nr:ferric reductase-like transmembrane domain-containing protein [Thermoflexaceae bacterium]
MNRTRSTDALAAFIGALVSTLILRGLDFGHAPWYISRSSGLVAYVLLTLSVVLGLLLSTRSPRPLVPRALAFDLHRFISILTLTMIGVHAGILLFDNYLGFGPAEILLPFASDSEPLLTAVGVVAAWSLVAITASFWLRRHIGPRAWRRLHYLSFASWLLSLVHGFAQGTDTAIPFVSAIYILSAAIVAGLLTYRIGSRSGSRTPATTVSPQAGPGNRESRRLASRAASD